MTRRARDAWLFAVRPRSQDVRVTPSETGLKAIALARDSTVHLCKKPPRGALEWLWQKHSGLLRWRGHPSRNPGSSADPLLTRRRIPTSLANGISEALPWVAGALSYSSVAIGGLSEARQPGRGRRRSQAPTTARVEQTE